MEQKTEASQAVDDLDALASRLSRIHMACLDNRPKQAVGEMIHTMLNMPEWNRVGAAIKAQPAPTEAAQGEDSARLADGHKSSTMVSDFYGPKVTLHYETTAQADAAHDTLVSMIERASVETGGVKS